MDAEVKEVSINLQVIDHLPDFHQHVIEIQPNPFSRQIYFHVPVQGTNSAILTIYSIIGNEVFRSNQLIPEKGNIEFEWNGENTDGKRVNPGSYLFRIDVGEEIYTGIIQKQ